MFPASQTDLIGLQQAVTLTLSQASSPDEALGRVLNALGDALGWPVGAAWRLDTVAGRLTCQQVWLAPDAQLPTFAATSLAMRLRQGEGLPGRVWSSRQSVWIADVQEDVRLPRAGAAADAGLRTAVGIPVVCGAELLGVLEFFRRDVTSPAEDLLTVMGLLGIQLGSYLHQAEIETALRSQAAATAAMLAAALDCFVAIDHDGLITAFNPAAERTFGYRHDEVIGQPMAELIVPPSLREAHHAGLARQLATGESHILGQRTETMAMRRDGSEFPVELTITRPTLPGPPQFVAFLRDLTQQKSTEAELRQAVSARDAFLSIASHELKTPLTSMQLHAESLRRHPDLYPLDAHSLAKIAHIEQGVQRLNALINDLLDVSRLAVGRLSMEPEPTDLVAVTREVTQRFGEHLSRSGSPLTLAAAGTVIGHWDRSRLDQVVTNLLSNAIKFGEGRPIALGIDRQEDMAVLTVRDQGIGIAPEHQDRLFQRFERLVSAQHFGGFGLGLWIVRQIIEAMGGTIRVESAPDRGSTFRVLLPLDGPSTATKA
jgi:PAS domain S-box-containing protein